jgi:diaminopimelate decarboxylase
MIDTTQGVAIGGLDANELAERYGTPLFVYDAAEIRTTWARIRGAFRYAPTHLHFAAVCNRNLHLLRLLRGEGAKLHANTPGDVFCGLRAGYDPKDIVFSGSNVGEDDLEYVLGAGVAINVDSLDDLRRACALGAGHKKGHALGLRMHLAEALPESRIGVREHELPLALAIARESNARVTALHVYCGTHGQSLSRYRESLDRLARLALLTPDIECINLGGGFGYDYRDPEEGAFPFTALARAADAALRGLSQRLGRTITLRVEPGRAAVAGSAVLLTRVRSVKREETRRYVGVDTTVANFTSPVVHGSRRRVASAHSRPSAETLADVCGSTTYSRDFIARDAPLPDVAVGDLLAVLDVGAYGYCMSSHFLSRPRAAEVFVDGGQAQLVTRRETFEDLVAAQIEPAENARCAAE